MRTPLAATIAAAIALAGCGASSGGKGRTVTVGSGGPVTVSAHEYRFDPKTIVVRGGGRLTLSLRNRGSLAHDLRVQQGGRDLGGTGIFTSGQSQTAHLALPPGTYQFLCTVDDHAQLGMKGTLVVK
jgi:plastocyanin